MSLSPEVILFCGIEQQNCRAYTTIMPPAREPKESCVASFNRFNNKAVQQDERNEEDAILYQCVSEDSVDRSDRKNDCI